MHFFQQKIILCRPKAIISHQWSTILCNWSGIEKSLLLKRLNHGYDGYNYAIFLSTNIIDWNQWWILALFNNLNPTILIWIPDRNCVTNIDVCNHVFTVLTNNLLVKHQPSQSYWMNITTIIPWNAKLNKKWWTPRRPTRSTMQGFFLANSIVCQPITKKIQDY